MRLRSHAPAQPNETETIDLTNRRLESMAQVRISTTVRAFRLSNNRLEILTEDPLKDFKSLISLDLSYNQIRKIENLFYLTSLHVLNLSHNLITVIENLEGNTHLRQLNLSDNAIHSIFIRSPLPSLASLDLSGNKFRRLMCPNAFPCLSSLRIDRCSLTSLTDCHKFLNLRKISASRNQIANFAPFYLTLLSHVDIDRNKISSLSGLAQFQSLIRIEISGNRLNDEGFGFSATFPELKEFRADGSNISDPSLIAIVAPKIVLISLTFSKVSSIENIQLLISNAKCLISLDVGDCLPESQSEEGSDIDVPTAARARAKYRDSIVRLLSPSFVWLDGIKIAGRGPQPPVPPSRMNFQLQEDFQIESGSEEPTLEIPELEELTQSDETSPDQLSDVQSVDSRLELRRYVALTDDESDGIELSPEARNESLVSSDSGPVKVDLERIGFPGSESSDDSFDHISAATDVGSEIFHVVEAAHHERGGGLSFARTCGCCPIAPQSR
jgi:Leucine-rich repeat (LRR) protein